MDGWMDGWTNEWMDERMKVCISGKNELSHSEMGRWTGKTV